MRQRNRIVNPGKCRVKNPVTTIRDKSMSILAPTERERTEALN